MIVNRWSREFRALYGEDFPTAYACIDCETSGFDPARDVVLEFGHCIVRDCRVADRLNLVIDWSNHDVVPDRWIRDRLERLERTMEVEGRSWRLNYDVMRAEGVKPARALRFAHDFLVKLQQSNILLVGHNAYSFDERMLRANFEGFLGEGGFRFGDNAMLDTGAIEKASQMGDAPAALPRPGDTLRSYFRRVTEARCPGVRWSLDRHCIPKYDLVAKHGVDPTLCHTAGYDAYLTHMLMEEFRARLSGDPGDADSAEVAGRADVEGRGAPAAASPPLARRRGQRSY